MPRKRKSTPTKKARQPEEKKFRENVANSDSETELVKIDDEKPSLEVASEKPSTSLKPEDGDVARAPKWNMKFSSWNVNGLRAWADKKGHEYINLSEPDIFCMQETKCDESKVPDKVKIKDYNTYFSSGDQEGYSGTSLYSKVKPINVTYGIDDKKHDGEGRVITAEYEKFYFITAYIPNSGRGLKRLDYRTKEWDLSFREYIQKLDKIKPVIVCGDLNVAHLDIDLKNPKSNRNKTAGFTDAEREEFTKLLDSGFIDSFRYFYPKKEDAYSYWSYMGNARKKNVGWRLDYFVVSERLKCHLHDSVIRDDVEGSDHCPIELLMNFE